MAHVPAETPVTNPVEEPTVAIAGLLLLQVPPGVALLNAEVPPTVVVVMPAMVTGTAFTVTLLNA